MPSLIWPVMPSDLESSYELFQDAAETMSSACPDTPRCIQHAPGESHHYRFVLQGCLWRNHSCASIQKSLSFA